MKVVLDTNVIVAAFASRGLCKDVFEYSLRNCDLVISDFIIEECRRVLDEKINLPEENVSEIITLLREEFQIVTPDSVTIQELDDPDDEPIIGTARSADASVIVTGDDDLLSLESPFEVTIYSPRSFWEKQKG